MQKGQKVYLYIIFILSLIILFSSNVLAYINISQATLFSENVTMYSLQKIDNNIYGVCINNGCNLTGTNTTVVNLITNPSLIVNQQNYQSMDNTTSGYIGLILPSSGLFPSHNLFMSAGSNSYYIERKIVLGTGGGSNTCTTNLYIYDNINSVWTLINSYNTGFCGSASSGQTFYYEFIDSTGDLRNPFNNNSLFYTGNAWNTGNSADNSWLYKVNSSTRIQGLSILSTGQYLLSLKNGYANNNYYTTNKGYNYLGQQIYAYNNISGTYGFVDSGSTSVDISDDYYYTISTDHSTIYRGLITGVINNVSGTSIEDISTSCLTQFTGFTNVFNDVECVGYGDCIFVGSRNNKPLLITFNGSDCILQSLTGIDSKLGNNGSLIDAYYDPQNNSYFVSGSNVLLRMPQSTVFHGVNLSNTTFYPTPLCMDNNYLCSETYKYDDGVNIYWYCNIDNSTFCNLGCFNNNIDNTAHQNYVSTYNSCNQLFSTQNYTTLSCSIYSGNQYDAWWSSFVFYVPVCINPLNYFTISYANCTNNNINEIAMANPTHSFSPAGVCMQSTTCTNDCNILGQNYCDSTTSFRICGQYDTDECLEYSAPNSCLPNQICSVNTCIYNNQTGGYLINPTAFTLNPYVSNSNSTTYQTNYNDKRVDISTNNIVHVQKFAISGTGVTYTGISCDYSESPVTIDNTDTSSTNNVSSSKVFSPINSASVIKLNFTLNNTINNSGISTGSITFLSSLTTVMGKYYFVRVPINKSICVYKSNTSVLNNELIYCDYSVNSYDDLQSVGMELQNDYNGKQYSIIFTNYRITSTIKYTRAITYDNVGLTDLNSIQVIGYDSSNLSINNFNTSLIPQYNGMTTTVYNNYDQYMCTYSTTGCRDVRAYVSVNHYGTFNYYHDWLVCINSLTSSTVQPVGSGTEDFVCSLFGCPLSTAQMLFYTFMVVFVASILMIIFGMSFGMSGALVGALTVGIDILLLILFAFIGFIPVWVIIIIGIICAGIVGVFIRNVVAK